MKPQKADECSPANPWRAPARERSLQGKEAVARAKFGTSVATNLWTSPKTNSSLSPKWSRYIWCLSSAMSLAKATRHPARSSPMRINPMPAKNSAKDLLEVLFAIMDAKSDYVLKHCIPSSSYSTQFPPAVIRASGKAWALCRANFTYSVLTPPLPPSVPAAGRSGRARARRRSFPQSPPRGRSDGPWAWWQRAAR